MRKIGINMHSMGGLTNEEYIKKIKALGFDSTFSSCYKEEKTHAELAELLAKYGIEYETVHAPYGHINDIWLDCEGGEAMYNELIACVNNCAAANVPYAVTHLSSGFTPPPITDLGRARFAKIVEHAQKKNVIIAFENQRKLANFCWAMETFSAEDSVGFCWDCGHESCASPGKEFMPLFGERIVCTHIHDNNGTYNHDMHLIPFDGSINYNRFAEHIKKSGYQGSLMLEVIASENKCYGYNFYTGMSHDEYLEKAANAVKKLRDRVDGNN